MNTVKKDMPLIRLARKGRSSKVKKGDFSCPVCGEDFDDYDDFEEHLMEEKDYRNKVKNKMFDTGYDEEDEMKMVKQNVIDRAIKKELARLRLRKEDEGFEEAEDFEEESEEDEGMDEKILQAIAGLSEKMDRFLNSVAPVEEEEEFEDVDVKHSVPTRKHSVAKDEQKHKPPVHEMREVDDGEDEREVEENNFKNFDRQGAGDAKKAVYENRSGKPKELPEKSKLSQKVEMGDTFPEKESVKSVKGVTPVAQAGRYPEVSTGYEEQRTSYAKGDVNASPISDILMGKKKAVQISKEIRKSANTGENESVFGAYGTIGGL
jgi:uncharacterized Zn finger protein (UPF0148 family)